MIWDCNRNQIFLAVFVMCVGLSHQKRDYYFKFNVCEIHSVDTSNFEANCTLMPKGKINTINGYISILNAAEKFGAGAEVLVRPLKGGNYMTLFNQTFPDLCPYFGNKKLPNLAQIAFDGLYKFGKMPKCPVHKDLYYLKEYYLSPELFPPYAPEAEFMVKGHFSATQNGIYKRSAEWYIQGTVEMIRSRFWKKKNR